MKTMKAMQLTGARSLRYLEVERPDCKENEVIVNVHCVGVCATDLEIYQGEMIYFLNGEATYPIIPGHEWSGEVVEIGSNVTRVKVGDRVVGETTISCGRCRKCLAGSYNLCPNRVENGVLGKDGACAEYMVYPAHALHVFDPSISYEQACLLEPAAVSLRGIKRLKVTPEDSVAVIGAGPVGLLAVQAAKAYGAKKVVLIDMRETRLRQGLELGCDEIIDLSRDDLIERAAALTNGEMFTRIIEASGSPAAIESMTQIAASGSRIVLLGLCGGKQAKIDLDTIVTSDIDICGSLGSPGVWESVVELLETNKLDTAGLVTHRFSLHELEQAFSLMERKDPAIIKIVIQVC